MCARSGVNPRRRIMNDEIYRRRAWYIDTVALEAFADRPMFGPPLPTSHHLRTFALRATDHLTASGVVDNGRTNVRRQPAASHFCGANTFQHGVLFAHVGALLRLPVRLACAEVEDFRWTEWKGRLASLLNSKWLYSSIAPLIGGRRASRRSPARACQMTQNDIESRRVKPRLHLHVHPSASGDVTRETREKRERI